MASSFIFFYDIVNIFWGKSFNVQFFGRQLGTSFSLMLFFSILWDTFSTDGIWATSRHHQMLASTNSRRIRNVKDIHILVCMYIVYPAYFIKLTSVLQLLMSLKLFIYLIYNFESKLFYKSLGTEGVVDVDSSYNYDFISDLGDRDDIRFVPTPEVPGSIPRRIKVFFGYVLRIRGAWRQK